MLIRNINFLCCLKRQIFQTSHRTKKIGENVMDFTYQKCFSLIKRGFTEISEDGNMSSVSNFESLEETEKFQEIRNDVFGRCELNHQLLVIQPVIKWGAKKRRDTTPELQLAESVSLVNTLNNWKVVDKKIISLTSFVKRTLFGKGNLEMLTSTISKNKAITGVFISIHMLTGLQRRELEETFKVPVFDRYTIVVQIFKQHAQTKEAKLQVAMAEIPYIRSRLRSIHEGSGDHHGAVAAAVGGSGETLFETRRRILSIREQKIKQALDRLRNQRKMLRTSHKRNEFPVVAVVGYTNSGKTSLIKALTGDKSLEPKDNLFATLDVTVHAGTLPSMLRVLYVDTVGFMSDIPTQLVESFIATLEDAMVADVIVHIRDVSHPDAKAQEIKVTETLASFNLGKDISNNIITVGNKIDLVSDNDFQNQEDFIPVSATKLTGIHRLQTEIEAAILKLTDRLSLAVRVPTGGDEARWLFKEATVSGVESDPENGQCSIMKVVITRANLERFRHQFIIRHST